MANPIKGHTVESFNEEMQREHKTVLEMGALVRSQIRAAAKTLQNAAKTVQTRRNKRRNAIKNAVETLRKRCNHKKML